MESLDLHVLRTLSRWSAEERRCMLVTVVRTWGSSPRPVGSIMAMRDDGKVVGSVSGGCIEDDLIHTYVPALSVATCAGQTIPQLLRYGVTADEAHRFGLPCGGSIELLAEFLPDGTALAQLVRQLEEGALVQRVVDLATGQVSLVPVAEPTKLHCDEQTLVNTFGPAYRMMLIGGGQLTEYLATMAAFCGFEVTVCDPREEYGGAGGLAGVKETRAMPDDAVAEFVPNRRSCVVALTHDPKLDDLALLQALDSDAFYVGAIGSRRNNQARRDRMVDHFDQTEQSLKRLRGPIGMYIGSKTPAEIAVSIMAEVLAAKNGVGLPASSDVAVAKDHLEAIERSWQRRECANDVTASD